MKDYNEIIGSLHTTFLKLQNARVTKPITIEDYEESEDALFFLKRGIIRYGAEGHLLSEGHALFIPSGKATTLSFTDIGDTAPEVMGPDEFQFRQSEFFIAEDVSYPGSTVSEVARILFKAEVFDGFGFFKALDIPAFGFENAAVNNYIYGIVSEQKNKRTGYRRIVTLKAGLLVVELIRHLIEKKLFEEKVAAGSLYFKDVRLVKLLNYVRNNPEKDLSNSQLADVAGVSAEYVSQYFKSLSGVNLQDYIEQRRMQHAVELLKTTAMSVADIGKACGYGNQAYFCKRFKKIRGTSPGSIRKISRKS